MRAEANDCGICDLGARVLAEPLATLLLTSLFHKCSTWKLDDPKLSSPQDSRLRFADSPVTATGDARRDRRQSY
jgi:hypothetical protein